jgi:hypothetical protein
MAKAQMRRCAIAHLSRFRRCWSWRSWPGEADGTALARAEPAQSCVGANLRGFDASPGPSLNHFVRPEQQRLWNRQAESLGGLKVDNELELLRPLDR